MDRRHFIHIGGAAIGAAVVSRASDSEAQEAAAQTGAETPRAKSSVMLAGGQVAVITPNGSTLPLRVVDGVKVGHLVAEVVGHEFAPGLRAECWGWNGSTPGPTIEAIEGDRLRIYVSNRLPEPTTVHWHGVILPNGMDGVAGLTQHAIPPNETYMYEFTVKYPGTFMYHPHYDEMTQIALGMVGMFIVHPKQPIGSKVDHDFALMTHEWRLDVGAKRPDPMEMKDFNLLTFNSKAFPGTEPLVVGRGKRVRIRLGNLGPMDHHPIHLHGLNFKVTATDGGYVPLSAQYPETTVLVPVGSTRVIEFVPEELGDWAMHCHMTHHAMTQMGHGLPPMTGVDSRKLERRMARVEPRFMPMGSTGMGAMSGMDMPVPPNSLPMKGTPGPFGSIDMGGMFTVLKVRENAHTAEPSGWYESPPATRAGKAVAAQMNADGVKAPSPGK